MELLTYAYYLESVKKGGKNAKEPDELQYDFRNVINYIDSLPKVERKIHLADSKKIAYLEEFELDDGADTVLLHMISARYAKIRNVVNTDTLKELKEKKKSKEDGDEEHTYLIIKFIDSKNAVCLIANNSNGVSMKKVEVYLNEFIKIYHKSIPEDKIRYRIEVNNIVSDDFLKNLEKMKKIKTVTLTVEGKKLSTSRFKDFSGKTDIQENVDIMLKPTGDSIFQNSVKDFFKIYNENEISKIKIKGQDNNLAGITFDTEKMKEKLYLTVGETYTGEPKEEDVKLELKRNIERYC